MKEWRSLVRVVQFISVTQTRSTRSDNEKRRVKNEGKKYRIDYFIFSNFSRFYILLSTRPLFGVYEARRERERERERGKQVTRKFCDVPETFDGSARHSNPQLPLILKAILSLPRSKDIFVERCVSSNLYLSLRDLETR